MSISITCWCGRRFEAAEADAGKLVRCPGCRLEWRVPKSPTPPDLLLPGELEPTATSGKAIASLTLGVLFFFACLSGLPAIYLGLNALRDIHVSKGRLRGRRIATAGVVLGVLGCLFTIALIMPATRSAREAARRSQCINNLKQLGLAMQIYYDTNGTFPPAAITDKNGRPLLSWRVALLPYIEASDRDTKFHLDEPWDSPHNLSLLNDMPIVYACPSDRDPKPGMTGYQTVIGPNTAFTPDFKPLTFNDFTDGLSNTILLAESLHKVPWTKPEDIPFDPTVPITGIGSDHGYHNTGFNTLFADGSVRFLTRSIEPRTLKALLTRNLGEVGDPDSY